MLDTRMARRGGADILAVSRHACPVTAARWITGLASRLPQCAQTRSLGPADRAWARSGGRFKTSTDDLVALPPRYTSGAREMYCRNVYLRTGLAMPTRADWAIDLGANVGLFSIWAAVSGAQVLAVEAQSSFAPLIRTLAAHNGVTGRVHVEIGIIGGVQVPGETAGLATQHFQRSAASPAAPEVPVNLTMEGLMSKYGIERIGLLKADIEGGEFALFAPGEDLGWLGRVDQMALEVHPEHGELPLLTSRLGEAGFSVDLRDNDGKWTSAASGRAEYAYCRHAD